MIKFPIEIGENVKKAFTLVEMLAIILILGIISLIAVPALSKVVEEGRKASFKVSVENAIQSVDNYLVINNIEKIPEEGLSVKNLKLKNVQQFIDGKIIMGDNEYEAIRVTNGRYCVSGISGNLRVVPECYQLDETAPIIDKNKILAIAKSNSITLIVQNDAIVEEESTVKGYTYELINDELGVDEIVSKEDNIYTFTALKNETTYSLNITVINTNDKTTTVQKEVTTLSIEAPTYSIDKIGYSPSKTVTVTYPERQEGYIYSYSIDGGENWIIVESGRTSSYTFTVNGTIIARVYDGTNYKTASSYTVSGIDTTEPDANIVVNSKTTNSLTVAVTAIDVESGILKYEYALDEGSYVDNGTVPSYKYTNVLSGNHILKARITNGAGLTKQITIESNPTELTVPIYSINKTGWATSKVVTITYPQRETGFIYEYSVDGGTSWVTLSGGIEVNYTFTNNGTIIARVTDGVNYKTASSYTISGIDTTSPSIPVVNLNGYTSGTWTNKNVTQTFTSTDLESGIQKYQYTVNNGITWSDCVNPWVISWDSAMNYYIRAVDNVGNTSESSVMYKIYIDKVLPTIDINPTLVDINKGANYNLLSGVNASDNYSGVFSIISSITNTNLLNAGVYTVNYTATDNAGNVTTGTRTLNVYVTWYRSRDITTATYYGNYAASSSTNYYCPSGYTSSGSGSSMTCSQTATASPLTTTGSAYCSEPTYSISGSSCVRTVSCSGCSGQGAACMNEKCGSGGYENNTWTCGTSSCTATMLIRYTCPSGYTNNSIYSSTCYACPSGYTTSGTGSSTTCSKVVTTSRLSNTTYSCPSGGTLSGTTCIRSYYSCSSGTLSGSSCYGSWSSWTKTVLTPSSYLEVQTELRLTE